MNKSERQLYILGVLQKQNSVDVKALAEMLGTSEMTIRRDLASLAEQYNVIRTYGGAYIKPGPVVRMISFDEERIAHRSAKEQIAQTAAGLVKSRQRIFIDAGSTTRIMLNYLPSDTKNVIVTNHLKLAEQALQFEQLSVIMLGGDMIRYSLCSSGPVAEEQIRRYKLDIAFLGAAAVGPDGRLYDGYSPEARFKASIFDVAEKIYLLVDSSKINTYDLNHFGSLSRISAVITDDAITEEGVELFQRHHSELIIAK